MNEWINEWMNDSSLTTNPKENISVTKFSHERDVEKTSDLISSYVLLWINLKKM